MIFDYATLDNLRSHHPAWRLLNSPHAPLVVSFFHQVFIAPNVRLFAAADLAEALEDRLYSLREAGHPFPKPAMEYLNDWAAPDKGWLRKFYRSGNDEALFDLTPAVEKAIAWLATLLDRPFVGTESRLLTLFNLLEQLNSGTEADPEKRLAELQAKRDAIDTEMARIRAGEVPLLATTAVKDRFQQFQQLAHELRTDFREVEANFRQLDHKVRERITLWTGSKGALLDEIMGERDAITDSDQGRSFRAFWEFLMSSQRQEAFSAHLERLLQLPAVMALNPDPRLQRIHYDWLEAGEQAQRTVAQLSQQLRRFLDDRAWLENRRITELLRNIERKALALRQTALPEPVMHLDTLGTALELPLERRLYQPTSPIVLTSLKIQSGNNELSANILFSQAWVDKGRLLAHIRQAVRTRSQISLHELVSQYPLQQGLAELIAYLQFAHEPRPEGYRAVVDETLAEPITWQALTPDGIPITRSAHLPRVIFVN